MFKKIVFILFLISLLLTWHFFKSVRIISPELNGLSCFENHLCVDNIQELDWATNLYDESLLFVQKNIGKIAGKPRIVFCSTQECGDSFGLGKRTAMHLPVGIIIGPRGWKKHYLVHELIHRLQQQNFGISYMYNKPAWYIEGMAYLLSSDPRAALSQPFQQYRQEFKDWLLITGEENMWLAGKDL